MRKWILLTILLTVSSSSFAQKIKVRRVKGNQAVVEFTGGALQAGQAYELVQDEFSEGSSTSSHRRYSFAAQFNLTNVKSDATGAENETDLSVSARVGWNFGQFEVGPLFSYSSDATGNVTINVMKGGGWADFNMIPNAPGELFIYGLGGYGAFGQTDGAGKSLSLMELGVMPFVKWFPTGADYGFRIDMGYIYQKQSGGNSGDTTITGIGSNAGLIAYF